MTYKHGLHEVKYQYGLHDTIINRITCTDDGIILEFDNGVYYLDESCSETELTKKCYMEIKINFFDRQKMWEHIEIAHFRRGKMKRIEYDKFTKMMEKSTMDINLDYYCPFADSLLIKGHMKQGEIEFVVTEIAELLFTFEA